MMCKNEGCNSKRVMNNNTLADILLFTHNIVVTQHQLKRDLYKMFDQFAEHFPFRIVVAVKKITQTNDAVWFCEVNEVYYQLKVSFVRFRRNWNPGSSEMIDLPQVNVCQK